MQLPVWNTYPGPIGEVSEGTFFSFQLSYTNPLFGAIVPVIISGQLPTGLTMNSTGLISGTISNIDVGTVFNFVVRLTNADGIVDRNFFISVDDIVPTWIDPTNLGSIKYYSIYEFQFSVIDLGGINHIFEKISGELPAGLELSASGLLSGITNLVLADTTYNFTLRAHLDDDKIIDKSFSITVVTTGNRAPLFNDPAGLIGNITYSEFFSFQFSAGDPDHNAIIFSATGLPPGFSLSTSGLLSGTLTSGDVTLYAFNITISDGFSFVSRIYTLNANNVVVYPVTWITPVGSIGSLKEGDKSLLSVKATSSAEWTRYELSAGSLPSGLSVDVNTGDIWGEAYEQVSFDTDFNFTIRAYNYISEAFRNFSITLINNYSTGATRVFASLYGDDRLLWQDLFTTSEIPNDSIFRAGDAQYGLIETPKILIVENLDNPSADDIFLAVQGVRRTYLTLGKVEVAKAIYNGTEIYDVLYRKIYDDSEGAALNVNIPPENIVVKPGSLTNLRTRLLTLGSSGGIDNLPLYMNSDYFANIPFAHVIAGAGQEIADKINADDVQKQKLYLRRVRVDRFIKEYSASATPSQKFILFDSAF